MDVDFVFSCGQKFLDVVINSVDYFGRGYVEEVVLYFFGEVCVYGGLSGFQYWGDENGVFEKELFVVVLCFGVVWVFEEEWVCDGCGSDSGFVDESVEEGEEMVVLVEDVCGCFGDGFLQIKFLVFCVDVIV